MPVQRRKHTLIRNCKVLVYQQCCTEKWMNLMSTFSNIHYKFWKLFTQASSGIEILEATNSNLLKIWEGINGQIKDFAMALKGGTCPSCRDNRTFIKFLWKIEMYGILYWIPFEKFWINSEIFADSVVKFNFNTVRLCILLVHKFPSHVHCHFHIWLIVFMFRIARGILIEVFKNI